MFYETACVKLRKLCQIIGVLVTYFVLVVQFANPSSCSPTTAATTPATVSINYTTAAAFQWHTCRILAGWPLRNPVAASTRCGLEVQQASVRKQTHLLCPFSFQFRLETIYRFCCHRIIIQHIPLGYHSTREKELSNILIAPTFNQLQWTSTSSSCCINLEHIC